MNAQVSMRDLFKALLPRDRSDGCLGMLTCYFDDSGTHDRSDIVLVAGVFGTEARMDCLDRNWKKHIDRPLCGEKPRLSRFHAFDCNNSLGEFRCWTRTETDISGTNSKLKLSIPAFPATALRFPAKITTN
jgi:hypothetical protein